MALSTKMQSALSLALVAQNSEAMRSTYRLVLPLMVRSTTSQVSTSVAPGMQATLSALASVPPSGCRCQATTCWSRM